MSVPKGYRENWTYSRGKWTEKKVRKGLWKFTYSANKRRKATSYGEFGKGTKGAWKINAVQYIEKTGKGQYKTKMIGTKVPLKFYVKKVRK